ncbi:O-antigen ligase family protein [Halanaerobacter jeridensis]|uniref:O-antigen ligase n=1 Tax=Halanaerobacter jeridensis TaxID=706427 RepID=A0A938XU50_9FIRM|nr:O-antigen ligase family protein [Halanaerobacter jeridensis]MBM7556939.1 O-antigen ligase [Halanaerobacter jeridensis]
MIKQLDDFFDFVILSGFFIYILGNIISLAVMNIGLGISLLGWIIKKVRNKDFNIPNTPYNIYILLFMGALVFSLFDTLNLSNSLDYLQRFIIPILIFYIIVDLKPSNRIIKFLLGLLFVLLIGSSFYGLWQFNLGIKRVNSVFFVLEFATLNTFLIIYTFLYTIWGNLNYKYRVLLGINNVLLIVVLIFTQTRGAWISLMLSLAIIFLLKSKESLIWFLIFIVIFFSLAPFLVPEVYIDRFISIFDLENNKSNLTRLNLWEGAVKIYHDYWINGIGLNNFKEVITRDKYYSKPMVSTAHAHNNFLQLAAETGTLGLVTFIMLFFMIIKKLYFYYHKFVNKNLKIYFIATLGIVISYLGHGLTEYTLEDRISSRLLWFIIGISMVIVINNDRD